MGNIIKISDRQLIDGFREDRVSLRKDRADLLEELKRLILMLKEPWKFEPYEIEDQTDHSETLINRIEAKNE